MLKVGKYERIWWWVALGVSHLEQGEKSSTFSWCKSVQLTQIHGTAGFWVKQQFKPRFYPHTQGQTLVLLHYGAN